MKYMAIIDSDEKPVSCEFIGCNGNVAPYLIGATTNIKALEQEPILDKIKGYINHIRGTGLGKKKSLEFIEKYTDGLKVESEDCISRKAALSLLHFHRNDEDKIEGYVKTKDILNLSSVTPTHKKGKWINGDPICPCCGENKFKDLDADIWADWKPKFCPNCGAKMESEE